MRYYSLNRKSPDVDFAEATRLGQAPDGGLYFPERIPKLSKDFISNLRNCSNIEIGLRVMKPFIGNTMPDNVLEKILQETLCFDFPLVKVSENTFALELFHGPTLAFKDVGARFMSRCLGYFNRNASKEITVLVATSGDTGGAVANGFLNVEGIIVVILYPSGKVSPVQELQLTRCGQNITALEVSGTFDDCQALVKRAFTDEDVAKKLSLTSANSINVARWLPQQLYYFLAVKQWNESEPPVISVPSGNFGNICAGLMARASGLPVKRFIAAGNANDAVPSYFTKGRYEPKPTVATLSNAMDVGNPSNFVRILELFDNDRTGLQNAMSCATISDEETRETIRTTFTRYDYVLDPHGAVAYKALVQELQHGEKGIFAATAHPVKFPDVVEEATGQKIPLPANMKTLLSRPKQSIPMSTSYDMFREWLVSR